MYVYIHTHTHRLLSLNSAKTIHTQLQGSVNLQFGYRVSQKYIAKRNGQYPILVSAVFTKEHENENKN